MERMPDSAGDRRLDAELAARGLSRSRTHAAALITAGVVTVDGAPVVKPSARVRSDQVIEVAEANHYVSRAAHKLIAALDGFAVDPAGRLALDVGHDQLDRSLRPDPRVLAVDGVNVRYLTAPQLTELSGSPERPSLVVGDLSFISLSHVIPAIVEVAEPGADIVLLVKPQFEVGRGGVREGIVRDAGLRDEAVTGVLWSAWDAGLRTLGVLPSPLPGSHGNREYLVHLSTDRGSDPSEWSAAVSAIA